ncbi:hypothetical protein SDC9_117398 [bioreactor metagenome]|uniref:Uncharacterized protein n=1 Tax=bioreactor metagenome TaxID=1076179 RepID=A0A645C518_9ZZZZ
MREQSDRRNARQTQVQSDQGVHLASAAGRRLIAVSVCNYVVNYELI